MVYDKFYIATVFAKTDFFTHEFRPQNLPSIFAKKHAAALTIKVENCWEMSILKYLS